MLLLILAMLQLLADIPYGFEQNCLSVLYMSNALQPYTNIPHIFTSYIQSVAILATIRVSRDTPGSGARKPYEYRHFNSLRVAMKLN